MSDEKRRSAKLGWAAVILNLIPACFWAFWGAIEAFHEGWFHETWLENFGWHLAYLGPAAIFVLGGLAALKWRRAGSLLYLAGALYFGWFFISTRDRVDVLALAAGGGGGLFFLLWWFGEARPLRWARRLTWGLPLLIVLVCSVEPAWRIAQRETEFDPGPALVEGNGVTLIWAPEGPGWPREGIGWDEARERCRRLSADGLTLLDEPVDIWRLPTVDEIARSMTRGGENAGGSWNDDEDRTSFDRRPDKEPPLWNPRSPIIYWWAGDEVDEDRAYRVVYHGGVFSISKSLAMGSQAFRAVRSP